MSQKAGILWYLLRGMLVGEVRYRWQSMVAVVSQILNSASISTRRSAYSELYLGLVDLDELLRRTVVRIEEYPTVKTRAESSRTDSLGTFGPHLVSRTTPPLLSFLHTLHINERIINRSSALDGLDGHIGVQK